MDPLSPLLDRFTLNAKVFFAGALCDPSSFERRSGLGTLHVLRRGRLAVVQPGGESREVTEPSVLFYPQPQAHGFAIDRGSQAELACAWIDFGASVGNPLLRGLPDLLLVPIERVPGIETTLATLFDEAFAQRPARQAVLNRLVEYILILLLRYAIEAKVIDAGLLSALGDRRLGKALGAMHERPEHPWSLESLAHVAGMSRARFAAHFRAITGTTPLDYLTDWRLSVAKTLLVRGTAPKLLAPLVGYDSAAAFTRVFSRRIGVPPARWLAQSTLQEPDTA